MIERESRWVALLLLGVALVTGALVVSPLAAALVLPAVVLFLALFIRPTLALPFLGMAIMVSDGLPLGNALGLPMTISKLSMLFVLGAWFSHHMAARKWPFRVQSWLLPFAAVLLVLVFGLIGVRTFGRDGRDLVIGFATLTVLVVAMEELADPRHLWGALRVLAVGWTALVVLSIPLGGLEDGLEYQRGVGFGANANEWAIMVLLALSPTVAVLDNQKGTWSRVLSGVMILATSIAVFQTVSRAGILVLFAQIPFLVYILRRRWQLLVVAGVAAAVGVFGLVDLDTVWTRFDSFVDANELEMDGSIRDRGIVLRFAWEAFQSNPITGIGTGGFLHEVEVASGGQAALATHNTYMQILAEIGLVGAAAFSWLGGTVLWKLRSAWLAERSPRFRRLVAGLGGGVFAFIMMCATMNGLTFTMAFFVVGLVLVFERISRLPSQELEAYGLS